MENLIKKIDQMKNLAVCQGCRSIHFTLKYALITKGQLMNIPKDKRLDFDIWYDQKNLRILKVSYSRMGNWEYRLKNFE